MSDSYEVLVEKEEMLAQMLVQHLRDNDIPCSCTHVYGAGLVIKSGMEKMRVYVPAEYMPQAKELLKELFPEDEI